MTNQARQMSDDDPCGTFAGRRSTAALVACLSTCPTMGGLDLTRAARGAGWLLARADCIGELPATWLRSMHPGRLIYALRTRAHGGFADESAPDRARRLGQAAATYDLVELEAPLDLVPAVLAVVPPARRLVTWRGPPERSQSLSGRLRSLTGIAAATYQLVVTGGRITDGIAPLEMLLAAGRHDVVAYADGAAGLWSRVLSPLLGSPFVFGSVNDETVTGEPSVARLVDDFGLPDPGPVQMIFGIAGNSVSHSLSPRLHNSGYRSERVSAVFLPFPVEDFDSFWNEMIASGVLDRLGLPLKGLTVSSPNKEIAMAAVAGVTPAATVRPQQI